MQPVNASTLVDRLRIHTSKLLPVPASRHTRGAPFVFKDLETCDFVMLRDESLRGALMNLFTQAVIVFLKSIRAAHWHKGNPR
ncbi:hypothetical protein HNY73_022786 [Argiope bruennichi]|uniref:Uncharacterized protein n=1 Tax=Argiope bruennichi TaxID=94029 RepID=A0A8T0E310_ARGBR|nr:hypothetical protein HNY73_022786 [Argiope bruennichi]